MPTPDAYRDGRVNVAQHDDLVPFMETYAYLMNSDVLRGTLLLAHEGINGTIAGPADGIRTVLAFLRAQPEFAKLEHKESSAAEMPFLRMKVRLKLLGPA